MREVASASRMREFTRQSVIVTLACAAGMSVGPTPMVSAVAGMFMKPVAETFDLSRTMISAVMLMSPLAVAVFAPTGGRLLDRFGVRRVLLPVVVLFALANAAMALVTQVWHYLALSLVISACISVHCYSSYTKVLALWFSRHRGVVTGATIACGSALGAAIIPKLVQPWIESYGWQHAYLGIAALVAFWGLPILVLFLREPRADERAGPVEAEHAGEVPGATPAQAIRDRVFWMLGAAMFLAPFTIIGTVAHLFPMLTERGMAGADAATVLSMIYIGGMVGQLSSGLLLDRTTSPRIVLVYFGGAALGVWLLHLSGSAALARPGALLLGLGQGAEMSILAYLASRYFGLRHYGAIYGRLYGFANFGIACGILSMGAVHDLTGTYAAMGKVFAVTILLVMGLFATLPAYRFTRD
ncbi:MFS transporter [Novosphingobium profundi]|uniref:MFS transporter n=1 Tax=Novosphingobium profundi TaxID=1774954 RepID=UPI001BD9B07F|nr:MFS transporter [Novosphingobium profundi]MBT0670484.1 MFS transporter [Novosphingobium profundi]